MYPELIYSTPFFISAVLIFVVGLFVYSQPRRPRGFWYLVGLCFSAAFWAATEGLLYLGLPTETNLRIAYIQHLGHAPLPPLTLLFSLAFFRFDTRVKRKHLLSLAGIAAAIIALAWTDPLHHLVYSGHYTIHTGPVPMLGLHHAPVWWLIMGYHYLLLAVSGGVVCRALFTTTGPLRIHAGILLVLMCLVWGSNAVYVSGNSPIPNMDLGPLAFILVAAAMAGGFYHFNFLDIHPIGRTTFFNTLENPILVLDTNHRLLDLNPAAEKVFALQGSDAVGKGIGDLFPGQPLLADAPGTSMPEWLPIFSEGDLRYFELHISDLKSGDDLKFGFIYTFHDVTERKHAEDAMRESQRLEGMLEIAHTVCQDMQPPLKAILAYSGTVLEALPPDHPQYVRGMGLSTQIERLEATAHKLMGITRYETRGYLAGRIIDIDKASTADDPTDRPHSRNGH